MTFSHSKGSCGRLRQNLSGFRQEEKQEDPGQGEFF
jgi:hypothetical protein